MRPLWSEEAGIVASSSDVLGLVLQWVDFSFGAQDRDLGKWKENERKQIQKSEGAQSDDKDDDMGDYRVDEWEHQIVVWWPGVLPAPSLH